MTYSFLDSRIEYLSGVGPKMRLKLNKLGISTVSDLFYYYPRSYRDFSQPIEIGKAGAYRNQSITIRGKVLGIANKRTSRRRFTVTEAVVGDDTGSIKAVWFNQPFLTKTYAVGRELILNGKISYNFFSKEIVLESPERSLKSEIVPIYSETAGVSSKYISKLILSVIDKVKEIPEWIPDSILKGNGLPGIHGALRNIHFPKDQKILSEARRRIAFDELFLVALKANLSKLELKKETAPVLEIGDQAIKDFVGKFPFELTVDQRKSAWQIIQDLKGKTPMNRLLNGDVGSGKTVVAAIAAYVAMKAGYNTALMAPTEILANQHYETFKKMFSEKEVGLLTSSAKINIDRAKVYIGTHALIQKDVNLGLLGLVIVDEQHRFGVKQRQALQNMGGDKLRPHFLSMTATPIPRTLHLSLFGDLDLSIIREKPKGRKEIKTKFVEPENRLKAYEFIRAQIRAGRQAFVICPLIEEDQNQGENLFEEERKSVKTEYEKLKKIFPEFNIGMLHGRMKSKEKDEVMGKFTQNKINILVSTSVVEVGVDVPNASVMIVEDAERFGLAQIHQFRGRVGRSQHQSFCFMFSPTISPKARKRLESLEVTSDGFKLAEIDLEERGPGNIFGVEQSGILDLKMASFSDIALIEEASSAAKKLIENNPDLSKFSHLREKMSGYFEHKHLE